MVHYIFCFLFLIYTSHECEIWKASECPSGPTSNDEELLKSESYTKEQLFAFCDAGKTYADCVNERLHCCDMRVEYATALGSLDAQLKRNARRVGKYCTGITETDAIHYRCLTTLISTISTTVRSTTTSMPTCDVEKVRSSYLILLVCCLCNYSKLFRWAENVIQLLKIVFISNLDGPFMKKQSGAKILTIIMSVHYHT